MDKNPLFWCAFLLFPVCLHTSADNVQGAPDVTWPLLSQYMEVGYFTRLLGYEPKSSYSSLSQTAVHGRVSVQTRVELQKVLSVLQRWAGSTSGHRIPFLSSEAAVTLTTEGSSMSFGEQSLPPRKKSPGNLMLDIKQMKQVRVLDDDNLTDDRIRVYAEAGVTWGELLKEAERQSGRRLIPFDTPSSDKISVAGSIASNTFSRVSHFRGSTVIGALHSFEWMTPTVTLKCSGTGTTSQRECFKIVPGSMGAGGVIVAMELDLRIVDPMEVVHTMVLAQTSGIESFCQAFHAETVSNTEWNQGVYAIIHDEAGELTGILMGSKSGKKTGRIVRGDSLYDGRCYEYEDSRFNCSGSFPLYSPSEEYRGFLISAARKATPYRVKEFMRRVRWLTDSFLPVTTYWFFSSLVDNSLPDTVTTYWFFSSLVDSSLPDTIKKFVLPAGQTFTDSVENYTFYHNGFWEAHGGYDGNEFPNTHQAWVMKISMLPEFMRQMQVILNDNPDYKRLVRDNTILQDVTPVPVNPTAMSPEPGDSQKESLSVVYQITVAVDAGKGDIGKAAIKFYRELSEQTSAYANVHILKETHVSDRLLKEQYRKGIKQVEQLRMQYDPYRVFTSALWERLIK